MCYDILAEEQIYPILHKVEFINDDYPAAEFFLAGEIVAKSALFQVNRHLKRHLNPTRTSPEII